MQRILFVCTGNHRRSPIAEEILKQMAKARNLDIEVASAGINNWYVGLPTDIRSRIAAKEKGYPLPEKKAVLIKQDDFINYDVIFTLSHHCTDELRSICPDQYQTKIKPFLTYAADEELLLSDSHYSGIEEFSTIVKVLEYACKRVIGQIDSTASTTSTDSTTTPVN